MSASDRTRWVGGITTIIGLVTLSLAFAGGATAAQQAAESSTSCASGGWTDTVTVSNSPIAANGEATIGGTGTALDGVVLPAGGGHQSLVLSEPLTVKAVTVAGTLSWAKGYHAPFSTTGLKPASCGPVADPATQAAAKPAVKPAVKTTAPVQHAAAVNVVPNAAADKYFVCKYLGTPGVDEHLQTGADNPQSIAASAVQENPIVVGTYFYDGGNRDYVLAVDNGQTETADDCPAGVGAPSTATVTVTGPAQTVTVTDNATTTETSTVTQTATKTISGDPVTVEVPGPTVTVTVTPGATTSDDARKVYVCKYVGKPGVDERLQTGQNPIDVSVNAIPEQPVVVGSFFADAQGRSFVLAFDTGQTPPTADDCPAVGVPPTHTTTVTASGTVTATVTVTQTLVGQGATVTETVAGPGSTVTETVTAPGQTVTVTQVNDVTRNVISCPPGAQVQGASAGTLGGSLAFTGAGDSSMMSLLGGAMTAAGLTLLFMARKRWSPRRH